MKKEFRFQYEHFTSILEMNTEQIVAVQAAELASMDAYAPYSNFKVGAALLLTDGTMIIGNNQENKAFPSGLCAERVALFNFGSQNLEAEIKYLAIVGGGEMLKPDEIFSPCGSCRQVMAEYADKQATPFQIILKNPDDSCYVFESISHLLPFIFGNK